MSTSQLVTYQHTAAVFTYSPANDVEPTQGWRMECDEEVQSRLAPPAFNVVDCIGESRRLTRRRGASASFTIYGDSFTLFGSATAGPFSVRIGNGTEEVREPETVTNGVLFAAEGLGSGAHRITLASAGDNTELRFQHVEFDAGVRSNWTRTTIGARESSAWTYSVGWKNMDNGIRGSNGQIVEMQVGMNTVTIGAVVFFKFQGNALWLFGNVMVQHSGFAVTLVSPESPAFPAKTQTDNFNSLSNYTVAGALMYFVGGLDPRVEHTLNITVLDAVQPGFDLIRAEVAKGDPPTVEAPSSSSSPIQTPTPEPVPTSQRQSSNTASVIGGTIGGLVAGLACVLALYYLRKRKRRQGRVKTMVPVEFTSLQPHQDAQSQAYSRTTSGTVPIFLPSVGQSRYTPTNIPSQGRTSEKRRFSSGKSIPVLTQGERLSGRAAQGTLPPAYSERGSSD